MRWSHQLHSEVEPSGSKPTRQKNKCKKIKKNRATFPTFASLYRQPMGSQQPRHGLCSVLRRRPTERCARAAGRWAEGERGRCGLRADCTWRQQDRGSRPPAARRPWLSFSRTTLRSAESLCRPGQAPCSHRSAFPQGPGRQAALRRGARALLLTDLHALFTPFSRPLPLPPPPSLPLTETDGPTLQANEAAEKWYDSSVGCRCQARLFCRCQARLFFFLLLKVGLA